MPGQLLHRLTARSRAPQWPPLWVTAQGATWSAGEMTDSFSVKFSLLAHSHRSKELSYSHTTACHSPVTAQSLLGWLSPGAREGGALKPRHLWQPHPCAAGRAHKSHSAHKFMAASLQVNRHFVTRIAKEGKKPYSPTFIVIFIKAQICSLQLSWKPFWEDAWGATEVTVSYFSINF